MKRWAASWGRPTFIFVLGLALAVGWPLAACSGTADTAESTGSPGPDATALTGPSLDEAEARAVRVSTTACGYAPSTDGSGVALGDGSVLTAAHVVAGATEISVLLAQGPDGRQESGQQDTEYPATVVAYDTLRDLALLSVSDPAGAPDDRPPSLISGSPPLRASLSEGQIGMVVGAATSGNVQFEVEDKTIIEIDEVRGSRRSQRAGYILQAVTKPGDSGSALYDNDGRLAGLLFAVSTGDEARSWATAAEEIDTFLVDQSLTGTFACDPDRSRLVRTGDSPIEAD